MSLQYKCRCIAGLVKRGRALGGFGPGIKPDRMVWGNQPPIAGQAGDDLLVVRF